MTDEQWETLTADQKIQAVEIMMQDIAVMDAMILIHGKEHGRRRAMYLLGYGPPC